jgi:hypothetical protein
MLRQQQCWKFAPVRRNDVTLLFRVAVTHSDEKLPAGWIRNGVIEISHDFNFSRVRYGLWMSERLTEINTMNFSWG